MFVLFIRAMSPVATSLMIQSIMSFFALNPKLKEIKDEAVEFSEREASRIGLPLVDYFNLHALGHENNCDGYLYLKHLPQGYDVP